MRDAEEAAGPSSAVPGNWLKSYGAVISPLIIGVAGVIATFAYNNGQLELARIKGMSEAVSELVSDDATNRKVAVSTLGLYDTHAVPTLITFLDDDSAAVRSASARSLQVIGPKAVPNLLLVVHDRQARTEARRLALETMSRIDPEQAISAARERLTARDESDANLRDGAVVVLGRIPRAENLPLLLSVAHTDAAYSYYKYIASDALWSISEIGADASCVDSLIAWDLIHDEDEAVALQTVWDIASVKSADVRGLLKRAIGSKPLTDSTVIRSIPDAIAWAQYRVGH